MSRLQAAIAKAQDTTGSVPNSGWYGASHDFATVEEALKVVERLAELPDDLIVINQKAMDRAAVVPGTDQKVEVAILQGRNSLKGLTVTVYYNGKVVCNNTALWEKALSTAFPN